MNDLISYEVPTTLAQRATALTIVDDAGNALALELARDIKAVKKEIDDFFAPHVDNAHKAHKALTTKRAETLKPLDELEKAINAKRVAYSTAKAERERAAQQAEQSRLAQIAKDEAARQAELEEKAEEARAFGADDYAEEVEADAKNAGITAVIAHRQAERVKPGKPEGMRESWKWRVVDKTLVPREFMVPDAVTLDFHARKKRDEPIPGIEFYPEYTAITRG
jgi:hypothetical protein